MLFRRLVFPKKQLFVALASLCLAISGCKPKEQPGSSPFSSLRMTSSMFRANFHGHSGKEEMKDDGDESSSQLHRAMQQRGIQFSVHSIHSVFNTSPSMFEQFQKQLSKEQRNRVPGLLSVLGEELTVAKGPKFKRKHSLFGFPAPGNLNHITLLGIRRFLANETPLKEACKKAHADGGVCIVNHPGPGPMMWEEDLWEAKEHRMLIDGLEVYNGMALAGFGKHFEQRYLEATAYSGLGMHIAALGSADTHGPDCVRKARNRLGKLESWAERLGYIPSSPSRPRPELDALTLLDMKELSLPNVILALKERRTIAVYNMPSLHVEFPQLGQVLHTNQVLLQILFSQIVERIELYREGELIKTWEQTDHADFQEVLSSKAAYVFVARAGTGRLTTSAVWYEPAR